MRRALRLGTFVGLGLAVSSALGGCALVDAGEFTEDFIEAQATMTELIAGLLENPDVVDADYEIAPYLAGRSSVTVRLVDDASDATWLEVVEAIDDVARAEELAGGVDVDVGTESQLSISYPADVTGAAIADETSAARVIQLRLKAPLLVEFSPRSGGYHRFLRVSADHPEATITVAENFRELDELASRSGAETTSWMLPGLQAAGGLPPESVMNLFRQLGTMPLTPTDAAAAAGVIRHHLVERHRHDRHHHDRNRRPLLASELAAGGRERPGRRRIRVVDRALVPAPR